MTNSLKSKGNSQLPMRPSGQLMQRRRPFLGQLEVWKKISTKFKRNSKRIKGGKLKSKKNLIILPNKEIMLLLKVKSSRMKWRNSMLLSNKSKKKLKCLKKRKTR